jgi:hypothetical protein
MAVVREQLVHRVNAALRDAEAGVAPDFSPEAFVEMLGLGGDKADGLTLLDRLIGNSRDMDDMRAVVVLKHGAARLIEHTNTGAANGAEEAFAYALGRAVTKQVMREGNICGVAEDLVRSSNRYDIIPVQVRDAVELAADDGGDAVFEEAMAMIAEEAERAQVDAPGEQTTRSGIIIPAGIRMPDGFGPEE